MRKQLISFAQVIKFSLNIKLKRGYPPFAYALGEASPSSVKIIIFDILFLPIIFLLNAVSANYRRI